MEFLEDPQYEQEVVRQGVWFIVLVHLRRLDSVALNSRPCQMLATFQSNILQHCWAQHVAYVWPPCYDTYVATCRIKFENSQVFRATFWRLHDVVLVWQRSRNIVALGHAHLGLINIDMLR